MATRARTITKNFFSLIFSEAIAKGLAFLLLVAITRVYGADLFGKYSYAVAITALFLLLVEFGLSTVTTRDVARDKSVTQKYVSNILLLKFGLSILAFCLLYIFTETLSGKDLLTKQLVYIMGLQAIINNFSEFFKSIFRAYERMEFEGLTRIIQSVFLSGLGFLIIWRGGTITNVAWAYVAAAIIIFIIDSFIIRRFFSKISLKLDFPFWKKIMRQSWPLALSSVFVSIYYNLDTVILSHFKTDAEVAWYNAAYRPILFLILIAASLVNTLFPILSQLFVVSKERLQNAMTHFVRMSAYLAVPLGFGGTLLAPKIILFLYGEEYQGGILAFQILIWTAAVIYINMVYGNTLLACDKQRQYLWGVGLGALINTVLNFIIIPRYGLSGAAATTLAAEIFVLWYMYQKMNKIVFVALTKHLVKPLLASLPMAVIIYLLIDLYLFLLVIIGAASYGLGLFVLRAVTKEDIDFLKELKKTS